MVYCGGALLLLLFSLLEHNLCHFLLVGGRTLAVGELQLDAAILHPETKTRITSSHEQYVTISCPLTTRGGLQPTTSPRDDTRPPPSRLETVGVNGLEVGIETVCRNVFHLLQLQWLS